MATLPKAFRKVFSRHVIGFIMLAYAIIFLLVKNPHDPYDRLIINDGKAYYAYLPALFIYQDFEYGFIEYYESKYYPSDSDPSYFKEFRFQFRGQTVNKAFFGIAVLMLPFFLLAHMLALLFGNADGYSMIYQYAIGFSAYFYLWLGLLILRKLLRHFTGNENLIAITLLAIALGTNLVYYTVVEGTMPHVYLFFLVNLFLLSAYRAINERRPAFYLSAAAVFALILITRPQNGFLILVLPFLAGTHKKFVEALSFLFTGKLLLKTLTVFIAVLMLQVVLWYAQTGYLLVYSYGDETFNFLKPEIVKLLFSYEKGWMIYTPLAFLALTGFLKLFRENFYRAVFLFSTFLVLSYVISSWWVWHYTSQFGQRVFIDFYGLLAILLAYGYNLIDRGFYKTIYKALIFFFIALNLFQFYQHLTWVYPAGPVNAKTYWQNFFGIRTRSGAFIPGEVVIDRRIFHFPAEKNGSDTITGSGGVQTLHKLTPHRISPLLTLIYGEHQPPDHSLFRVVTEIFGCTDSVLNLQFDFFSGGKKYSEHIVPTNRYLRCHRMNRIETVVFLPLSFHHDDSVRVSLASPSVMDIRTGNHTAELIFVAPDAGLRWIPRPLNSVVSKQTYYCNMDDCDELFNLPLTKTEFSRTGGASSVINTRNPFGAGLFLPYAETFVGQNKAVRINAYTYAETETGSGRLVISIGSENEVSFYKTFEVSFKEENWKHNEILAEIPRLTSTEGEVRIYFWDTEPNETWYIDDFSIDFLTLSDRFIPSRVQHKKADSAHDLIIIMPDTVVVDQRNPFYGPSPVLLSDVNNCRPFMLVLEAKVLSDCWFPLSAMVVGHYQSDSLFDYQAHYFSSWVQKGQWRNIVHEFAIGECQGDHNELKVYFWNPSQDESLMVSDFKIYMRMN